MDLKQLRNKLKELLIENNSTAQIYQPFELLKFRYKNNLEVRFPANSYHINQTEDIWLVFYSERGSNFDKKTFKDEQSACLYFWNWISKVL